MPVLGRPKHERFAQLLAKGETQRDAYEKAGYAYSEPNASRLTSNEKVRARVAELQQKAATRVEITVADIARQLDEDRTLARELGSPSAAVAATMGKAKVLGLIVEKQEAKLTFSHEDALAALR